MKSKEFEIVGKIYNIETIAIKHSIREYQQLEQRFGKGRWRKLKGVAKVRLEGPTIRLCELHWYEAHGIGTRKMKIKSFLD